MIFFNTSAPPTDVTFDNPAQVDSAAWFCVVQSLTPSDCASGNIAAFTQDHSDTLTSNSLYRARSFPVRGTYKFHSKFGTTGEIIVTDSLVK
ncbi:MAG TPA: hypothetical protein VFA43_18100 [Gemmatimonadaceae bacterium]|nr:hypothetical protein [Gemmatimonadaceae bacterium]